MLSLILFIIFVFSSLNDILANSSHTLTSSMHKMSPRKNHTYTTFSARLIHHSSPESPFFNPNYTRSDHIRNYISTSLARSRYFSQRKAMSGNNYVAAPVYAANVLMEYAIGTPPVVRYGMLDTGSSFTWFQCLPCINCYDQGNHPLFNPKQSTSYRLVACNDSKCRTSPSGRCVPSSEDDIRACQFYIEYMDETHARGIVSTETITLSLDNHTKTMKNMIFGCANDNKEKYSIPGIVGLGNASHSLVRQLGVNQFSYFLSANGSDINGAIHFGTEAQLSASGANTPMLPNEFGLYFLKLLGISVDGSDLDLPPGFFDLWKDNDGILSGFAIDTGSTYTVLTNEAFEKLKDAIVDEMYMYTQVKNTANEYLELCFKDYQGGAPEVVFQFSGLDYALCDSNLWIQDNGLHCLALIRSPKRNSKLSILGMYQQRNVQVGYDLDKKLLTLNYPDACPNDVIDFLQQ